MKLEPGSLLAHYKILEMIGKGGMGEVYRASDSRLPREVAIKTSSQEFSERFAREAKVIASLNHPNICTLFDVGPSYLVMEMIEGPTLSERIKEGAMSLDETSGIMRQVADALDYAHEKGVVHRDLKPGNIKIRPDGLVKVLDFGLAKAGPSAETDADPENSPTLTMGATQAGVVLGTAAYMAPEQAAGKVVDKRADVWAFGVVFYEMLTGTRMHRGDSVQEILAAVLKDEPDLSRIPAQAHRLIKRCLEKDPNKRLRHVGDVMSLLDDAPLSTSQPAITPLPPPEAPGKSWLWPALAASSLAVAISVGAWAMWPKPVPIAATSRFQVELPKDVVFNEFVSMSPDGRKLLFNATGLKGGLWIRDLDTLEWRQLAGTERAVGPSWSPDGKFLGFGVARQLKKISLAGGPPQTLADSPYPVGTSAWVGDGTILFGSRTAGTMLKVSQAGGVPTPVTTVDAARGERFHALPTLLPDGRHFIYHRGGTPQVAGMYGGSLDTKPAEQSKERILAGSTAAFYVNGYVFFVRDHTLMAQPFNAGTMKLTGEPVPVVEPVATTNATGTFSVSPSGALAYRAGTESSVTLVQTWFDRQGKMLETFGQPGSDEQMTLSPDGTRGVIRSSGTGNFADLWTLDFARGLRTRFTFRQSTGSSGVWSPDGSRIAFAGNNFDTLFEKASTGATEERELLKEPGKEHWPTSWSHDGRFLLYDVQAPGGLYHQFVLPLEGEQKPVALLTSKFNEGGGSFSPDMRWIAYASDESGRNEVYVRPFNAGGPSSAPTLGEGKWQVSRDGGSSPRWRADGKEILFQAPANAKMAVEVKTNGSAFEPGIPQRLFQIASAGWDVTGDGKRFLLSVPPAQQSTQTPITVVLNWPALLKK